MIVAGTGAFYGGKPLLAVNDFLKDKARLEATLSEIEASRSRTPVTGEAIIEIRKDEGSGSKRIQLPKELIIKGGFKFFDVSGPRTAKASGVLEIADGIWHLVINVETPSPAAQMEAYKVRFAVIP